MLPIPTQRINPNQRDATAAQPRTRSIPSDDAPPEWVLRFAESIPGRLLARPEVKIACGAIIEAGLLRQSQAGVAVVTASVAALFAGGGLSSLRCRNLESKLWNIAEVTGLALFGGIMYSAVDQLAPAVKSLIG